MKKFAVVIVLCLAVLALVFAGRRATPVRVTGAPDAGDYSIDLESIEDRDDHIVAWVKFIHRGEEKKRWDKAFKADISHSMDFLAHRKAKRQLQPLSAVFYDKDGNVVHNGSWKYSAYNWVDVVPGSKWEVIYDAVMRHHYAK